MTPALVHRSLGVLATHARSFYFASRFLPPPARRDAAVLYALCRHIDDLADESPSADEARIALAEVRTELAGPVRGELVAAVLAILDQGPGPEPLEHLLDGVVSDLLPRRVADDAELVHYGYQVAGTVGWMMCAPLGVTDPRARRHAIELGIAMQITNICRDVLEDAERNRVYLPATRLRAAGIDPQQLVDGTASRSAVAAVVLDLLDLADQYYASGEAGLRYLPFRARLGIAVAARVYREIGTLLRAQGGDTLAGRVATSGPRKLWVALGALGTVIAPRPGPPRLEAA